MFSETKPEFCLNVLLRGYMTALETKGADVSEENLNSVSNYIKACFYRAGVVKSMGCEVPINVVMEHAGEYGLGVLVTLPDAGRVMLKSDKESFFLDKKSLLCYERNWKFYLEEQKKK